MISTSWTTPLSPGNIGWPSNNSARTHPADQTSTTHKYTFRHHTHIIHLNLGEVRRSGLQVWLVICESTSHSNLFLELTSTKQSGLSFFLKETMRPFDGIRTRDWPNTNQTRTLLHRKWIFHYNANYNNNVGETNSYKCSKSSLNLLTGKQWVKCYF